MNKTFCSKNCAKCYSCIFSTSLVFYNLFFLLFQFSDCYSDLGLFNPFDAFNQDLLSLDRLEEQVFQSNSKASDKIQNTNSSTTVEESITMEEPMEENAWSSIVTDDELASLNIKDLNRKLKEKGLPKETIEKLKQRRRTLKNRKYATE